MNSKQKIVAGIASLLIIVVVVALLGSGHPLSSVATGSSCGLQNLNASVAATLCKSLQSYGTGGLITSFSQASFVSNNTGPFATGSAYLVNYLVNGYGQQLTGTQQQILTATGQSQYSLSNPTAPVGLTFSLNDAHFVVPYQNTGDNLNQISAQPQFISYTVPYLSGVEVASCSGNYLNNYVYSLTCISPSLSNAQGQSPSTIVDNAFYANLTAFSHSCQSNGPGAVLVVLNGSSSTQSNGGLIGVIVGGYNSASQPTTDFYCATPKYTPETTAIYTQQGTWSYFTNVSVSFINGGVASTAILSPSTQLNAYLDNGQVFVDLYGYQQQSSGISISGAPVYVLLSSNLSNTLHKTNITITQTHFAAALAQEPNPTSGIFPPSVLSSDGVVVPGVSTNSGFVPNAYYAGTFSQAINHTNTALNGYLTPVQSASFYQNSYFTSFAGTESLVIPVYNRSLFGVSGINPGINTVPFYPLVQVVAKLSTLSIFTQTQPTGSLKITSVSPSPFAIRSGVTSQLSVNILNNYTASQEAIIQGSCGAISFGTGTSAAYIPVGQSTQQFTVQSAYLANGSATQSIPCTLKIYSTFNPNNVATYNFTEALGPTCSASQGTYNSTSCKQFTTVPTSTTTIPPVCTSGNCNPPIPNWELVVIAIVILILLYIAYRVTVGSKRGGRSKRSSSHKAVGGIR